MKPEENISNTDLNKRVDFNRLRYANCWEDADVLLEALKPTKNASILSIASAGDNSFSLLCSSPALLVAADLNPVQLHLVELKKAAISSFTRTEVLGFLGFDDMKNRIQLFNQLKPVMSDAAFRHWQQNSTLIETGIIHHGKFEKYFQLFSKRVLPLIHSKKNITELFRNKSHEQQQQFYSGTWNNIRWRLLFKLFFSKRVMGEKGRDPEFLKQVEVNVSDYIFNKAAKHLSSTAAQNNFILRYNLCGNFNGLLPHYLREENFDLVKQNLSKMVLFKGFAEQAIAEYGKFDCMNLSDIFEYLDVPTFRKVSEVLIGGCNANARIAYWNLMVPRRISENAPDVLTYEKEFSEQLTQRDKGFFYNRIILETKI